MRRRRNRVVVDGPTRRNRRVVELRIVRLTVAAVQAEVEAMAMRMEAGQVAFYPFGGYRPVVFVVDDVKRSQS